MFRSVSSAASRIRLIITRILSRMGAGDEAFLLILAVLVGIVTAAAAVSFHELIDIIRRALYSRLGPRIDLYGRGLFLLALIPALGGLAVGVFSNYIVGIREGQGIVDVLEQVSRSSGVIDPMVALEKILTSAVTIGTGGSAGAEGPIVQIGAAIASAFGQLFRIARQHMPVLIGCGSAAGISAIFNSPIGGVFFTLEVVLRDFSLRAFTPVIVASVVANFTTQSIFRDFLHENYSAIFNLPDVSMGFRLSHLGSFALLGLVCGVVGVSLTRLMYLTEHLFAKLRVPRAIKPAIGGAMLGLLGILYILLLGKVIDPMNYAMPAFFGDGYGAVLPMLTPSFYTHDTFGRLFAIFAALVILKLIATCFTLGSGGSGGIIAPSLFLGAVTGATIGLILRRIGLSQLAPHAYALVGLGAVLAAVIHAPLAAILILFEVTRDYQVTLPAMLACIIATAAARVMFKDSIYTLGLRRRGVKLGTSGDLRLLQRLSVEQVSLEPAVVVHSSDPFQHIVDLMTQTGAADFIVVDRSGSYEGMVTAGGIRDALIDREAVPLLLVAEVMRPDVPVIHPSQDLAAVLDTFAMHDAARLPVALSSGKIIGLISRASLMRRYQQMMAES